MIMWCAIVPVIVLSAMKAAIMNISIVANAPAWALVIAMFLMCALLIGVVGIKLMKNVYKA